MKSYKMMNQLCQRKKNYPTYDLIKSLPSHIDRPKLGTYIIQQLSAPHSFGGHSKVERVTTFIRETLEKIMVENSIDNWHSYIDIVQHLWNTTPTRLTDVSPSTVHHNI